MDFNQWGCIAPGMPEPKFNTVQSFKVKHFTSLHRQIEVGEGILDSIVSFTDCSKDLRFMGLQT